MYYGPDKMVYDAIAAAMASSKTAWTVDDYFAIPQGACRENTAAWKAGATTVTFHWWHTTSGVTLTGRVEKDDPIFLAPIMRERVWECLAGPEAIAAATAEALDLEFVEVDHEAVCAALESFFSDPDASIAKGMLKGALLFEKEIDWKQVPAWFTGVIYVSDLTSESLQAHYVDGEGPARELCGWSDWRMYNSFYEALLDLTMVERVEGSTLCVPLVEVV